MKVFKFGGASVKSAEAVRHVVDIIKSFYNDDIMIVLSAMDKMTNMLEKITDSYFYGKYDVLELYNSFVEYHFNIINELFESVDDKVFIEFNLLKDALYKKLKKNPSPNYDFEYDQIVPYGELFSTMIMHNYLNKAGIKCQLYDARNLIKTDNKYREAKVDWDLTTGAIRLYVLPYFLDKSDNRSKIAITQGFIGGAAYGYNTTLGREGSDYTAAIIAFALKASEVIIWKDVPGILNADPRFFNDTKKVDKLSYEDAIELTYYGASVIHPDTIKPLQNDKIPLYVKSFVSPDAEGTEISERKTTDKLEPFYIIKPDQILISISPKDFSYIAEKNLIDIFSILDKFKIRVNAMQISAIGLSICINNNLMRVGPLIKILQENYKVKYNEQLNLITIRHYNNEAIKKIKDNKTPLLEQISRLTYQVILKNDLI
ncbi:MAG TPA: aspartate kinase [Bacteroidales bacterium]|mgnify:CR=1 FL=1|nr:aspartate kinase [Bacteroidales bacterium]